MSGGVGTFAAKRSGNALITVNMDSRMNDALAAPNFPGRPSSSVRYFTPTNSDQVDC